MSKSSGHILGLMSGTSLDGLDIACCRFMEEPKGQWRFELLVHDTVSYDQDWLAKLSHAQDLSALELLKLNQSYGLYLGQQVNDFINRFSLDVKLIGSHGHTVFHQPEDHFTFQLGSGQALANETQITTVADFRTADVMIGGQGAPLAPLADDLLFADCHYRLNLGGFANVSFRDQNELVAFDICPVNFVLNDAARLLKVSYDKDGQYAKQGRVDERLLEKLNSLEFYQKTAPKSLGREWVETCWLPLVQSYRSDPYTLLATYTEHIAQQISMVLNKNKLLSSVMITGGGARNKFLIQKLRKKTHHKVVIPSRKIVDYKEAVIFALLAYLRLQGQVNIKASVTGAVRDSSSGVIFKPV
ncbi:MAG: anhydro-N-acetylmuramic acid kinase [Bacteroidota bacterium]